MMKGNRPLLQSSQGLGVINEPDALAALLSPLLLGDLFGIVDIVIGSHKGHAYELEFIVLVIEDNREI